MYKTSLTALTIALAGTAIAAEEKTFDKLRTGPMCC